MTCQLCQAYGREINKEDLQAVSTRLLPMSRAGLDVERNPLHVVHVALCVPDLLDEAGIIGLCPPLYKGLEGLLVLVPLLKFLVRRPFLDLRRGGVTAGALARFGLGFLTRGGFLLPLAAFVRAAASLRGRRRHGRRCTWDTVVIMNTPHVVSEVPLPGKATSGVGAFASLVGAKEGLVTVAMHRVGLTFMAQ